MDADERGIDPEGFERRLAQYDEWLRVHFTESTATEHGRSMRRFVSWCADRGLTRPSELTRPILERFQAHLHHHRRPNGRPLSLTSQRNLVVAVRAFYKWLARSNYVLSNPAADLLLPRLSRRLPKHVLTEEEAERVIAVPDTSTPHGVRDRAILETLYSTAMRRMEIVGLALYDVDADRGVVTIRMGKGRKDRVVPIGPRALAWIDRYVQEVRPTLVVPPDVEQRLFLTQYGQPFVPNALTELVRGCVERSGIAKRGGPHLFRHTCATLMLEHGADVRFIQALLGHSRLDTTSLYTQVSIRKLQQVHAATHPADLPRTGRGTGADDEAKA